VRLNLNRGTANTSGKLKLAANAGKPLSLAFDGGFSVDKLDITEEESGASFLGWARLASNDLHVGLAPNRVHIGLLRATDPFAKILIHEDGTRNIQKLMRNQPARLHRQRRLKKRMTRPQRRQTMRCKGMSRPSTRHLPPASTQVAQAKAEPRRFPLDIAQLRIDNGKLDFADLSLTPNSHSDALPVRGDQWCLQRSRTVAQLELDGKVDEFGSARHPGHGATRSGRPNSPTSSSASTICKWPT